MEAGAPHRVHIQRQDIVHEHGLVRKEWLAMGPADQRTVMATLGLDERVQVLTGREDLAGGLRAVELARVAPDRFHLACELLAHVDDERRLDRVLAVGERVEDLVWPVRCPRGLVPREARQKTGVPRELGSE